MGNTPSIQPPVDGIGQAVLYFNGFSYNLKGCGQGCSCSSTELLSPPSAGIGGVVPQSADQVPRELEGSSVTAAPQEFAAGINKINATGKRLVPGGLMSCYAQVGLLCLLIPGAVLLLVGSGICEDDSPKDYWRTECVEMDDDCRSRQLEPLESFYPECRSSCTASMSDEELLATANPDGGQCLLCPVDTDEVWEQRTRGCQCAPTEDIRRNRCEVKKDKGRTAPGCEEFQYIRVCDDITHPLVTVGLATIIFGIVLMTGVYVWIGCVRNPGADRDLAAACQTLSSQSQTGTSWRYEHFTAGHGKHKQYFKCVVVTSAQQGNVVMATNVRAVKTGP